MRVQATSKVRQTDSGKSAPALKGVEPPPAPVVAAPETNDPATIKVDTTLVLVPISVFDRDGRPVTDLRQRDFHIFEENVEQEIDRFSSTEVPFSVALLLGTSRSMRLKGTDVLISAAEFARELQPQDRLMVVSFNSAVNVDTEFSGDSPCPSPPKSLLTYSPNLCHFLRRRTPALLQSRGCVAPRVRIKQIQALAGAEPIFPAFVHLAVALSRLHRHAANRILRLHPRHTATAVHVVPAVAAMATVASMYHVCAAAESHHQAEKCCQQQQRHKTAHISPFARPD